MGGAVADGLPEVKLCHLETEPRETPEIVVRGDVVRS